MEHKISLYKQQVVALEKENQTLREQLTKIQQYAEYFKKETNAFVEDPDPSNRRFKGRMFRKYIEDLHEPRNLFQQLLRNFYQYVVQHLELEKLQKTLQNHVA